VSKELKYGVLLGKGSIDRLLHALEKTIGNEWAIIMPYLEECRITSELEIVAAISHLLGKPLELTPTLKARIAECLTRKLRLLPTLEELLAGGEVTRE